MTPSFAALTSTRPRKARVRAIVLHTTGGIRPPLGVYETLRARGLSVHWVVGIDGECVQMAPHHLVCMHAGAVNAWTVGIEFVSPLLARTSVAEKERKRGVRRDIYRDRVRGRRELELLDMTEAQTRAGLVLVEQLCDVLELPRRVPMDGDALMRRQMTPAELARFDGLMGHYHAHGSKLDPGTRFLERLRERWFTASLRANAAR